MSEERTNMAIRDLKHNVIDYMSFDVQDDFEMICKYITSLQQKVEQLENMRKEAVDYMKEFIFEPLLINEDRKLIMFNENLKNFENILNKGDK